MTGIFVSYRRADSGDAAGRLFDHLARRFGKGQVFMDVQGGIPRGADFEVTTRQSLERCRVLLALIGPEWSSCTDEQGRRRLDREDDWVRTEIATALRRAIPVFPVVFGEAPFPPPSSDLPHDLVPLARHQLSRIRNESWEHDVGELLDAVGRHVALAGPPTGDSNLAILRQRVREFWIRGVLESASQERARLSIVRRWANDAVDHPFGRELLVPEPEEALANIDIDHVFDDAGKALLVLGEPGSGKTTTLLQLADRLLARAESDDRAPTPVVFNLSSWGQRRNSLLQWMELELRNKYYVPRALARSWLEAGHLSLILDGLDELPADRRAPCIEAINEHLTTAGAPGIAVGSRLQEYMEVRARLRLNRALALQPLTVEQVRSYAPAWVQEGADPVLVEITKTPLMLSIMSAAYENAPVAELQDPALDTVDKRRAHVFDRYVEQMFRRHKSRTRPGEQASITKWVAWVARTMEGTSSSIFLPESIQPALLLTRLERCVYVWISRMLFGLAIGLFHACATIGQFWYLWSLLGDNYSRGYESIVLSASLSGACIGMAAALVDTMQLGRAFPAATGAVRQAMSMLEDFALFLMFELTAFLLLAAVRGLVRWEGRPFEALLFPLGVMLVWRNKRRRYHNDIQTVESIGWSWPSALYGSQLGFFVGYLYGITETGRALYLGDFGMVGVQTGLYLGLPLGFVLGGMKPGVLSRKVRPNKGIWLSAINAMMLCAASAIVIAAVMLWVGFSDGGVGLGSAIGPVGFAIIVVVGVRGGMDFIQHYVLRAMLAARGYAPARLVRFLDHAADLLFLKKVGGGYIFVHRLLQEHFAAKKSG